MIEVLDDDELPFLFYYFIIFGFNVEAAVEVGKSSAQVWPLGTTTGHAPRYYRLSWYRDGSDVVLRLQSEELKAIAPHTAQNRYSVIKKG